MPIAVSCPCGKSANVGDSMAGRTLKCPQCGKPVKVPQPAAGGGGGLDDLFAEEGFTETIESACPACGKPMKAGAVLCTKCGFNKQTGQYIRGHKVAGVDIDMGTVALQKAEASMARDEKLQKDLLGAAGLPPWALAMILTLIGGATTIGVIAVNTARAVEGGDFDGMAAFLILAGVVFGMLALGAFARLVMFAFSLSPKDGALSLTIVYLFYLIFTNFKKMWKMALLLLIMGGLSVASFMGAR